MSYDRVNPTYYQTFQQDTPFHAGAEGWTKAPWPTWGDNPNLAGRRRLATDGLGADGLGVLMWDLYPESSIRLQLSTAGQRYHRSRPIEFARLAQDRAATYLQNGDQHSHDWLAWYLSPPENAKLAELRSRAVSLQREVVVGNHMVHPTAGLGIIAVSGLGATNLGPVPEEGVTYRPPGTIRDAPTPAAFVPSAMPGQPGSFPVSLLQPSGPPTFFEQVWKLVGMASGAACAYHGYKRNESAGWAVGWGAFGSAMPIVALPIAFAQGFGKPAKK